MASFFSASLDSRQGECGIAYERWNDYYEIVYSIDYYKLFYGRYLYHFTYTLTY